jgi:hypothetical protein
LNFFHIFYAFNSSRGLSIAFFEATIEISFVPAIGEAIVYLSTPLTIFTAVSIAFSKGWNSNCARSIEVKRSPVPVKC